MRIVFIGAGAVGGWFGGKLQQAGHDVRFIARGKTLKTLHEIGLTLIDEHGNKQVLSVTAADNWADLVGDEEVDVVISTTKALPGADPFPEVPAGVPIITTQNSVEVPYLAAERFGEDNVFPGIIRGFFVRTAPAVAEFRPGPESLNVGTFDGSDSELVWRFIAALNGAGVDGDFLPNIWVDVWAKAMFVATFGALGAVAQQPIGYLRSTLRDSLQRMVAESDAVARALGVPLADDAVAATMAFADAQGPDNTSSMQRDYLAGIDNELDAQLGAIRRMGDKAGVDTPTLDLVQGIAEAREATQR